MKRNESDVGMGVMRVDRRGLLAGTAGVAAVEVLGRASPAAAKSPSGSDLAGVWSGVAVSSKPGAWGPFRGEATADADGGFVSNNFVVPSTAVGYWKALGGKRYTAVFRIFLFKSDGTPLGSLHAVISLTRQNATTMTGAVKYQKLDSAGSVIKNGSGTVTFKRIGP